MADAGPASPRAAAPTAASLGGPRNPPPAAGRHRAGDAGCVDVVRHLPRHPARAHRPGRPFRAAPWRTISGRHGHVDDADQCRRLPGLLQCLRHVGRDRYRARDAKRSRAIGCATRRCPGGRQGLARFGTSRSRSASSGLPDGWLQSAPWRWPLVGRELPGRNGRCSCSRPCSCWEVTPSRPARSPSAASSPAHLSTSAEWPRLRRSVGPPDRRLRGRPDAAQ